MPRQAITYQDFKGLNMATNPGAMEPGDLSELINMVVTVKGRIQNMGGPTEYIAAAGIDNNTGWSGGNLCAGTLNYNKAGTEAQTNYLFAADAVGSLWWYDYGGSWATLSTGLGNSDLRNINIVDCISAILRKDLLVMQHIA